MLILSEIFCLVARSILFEMFSSLRLLCVHDIRLIVVVDMLSLIILSYNINGYNVVIYQLKLN
jgi:hypothetical protein